MSYSLHIGDALSVLKTMARNSVNTVCTSPPYWNLRDYGVVGQLGQEATPQEYVENLVTIFREVRNVLRDDGTLWLNLGDCYVKKQLLGLPWRVAFALQDDGWILRSDVIWSKPNVMPSSVKDRPTTAHEYLFLFSKRARYHYDHEAIKEPAEWARWGKQTNGKHSGAGTAATWVATKSKEELSSRTTRNKRSVWTVPTKPFKDAHFATFPPKLIEPCILAGTSEKGCCPECRAPWKRLSKTEIASVPRARQNILEPALTKAGQGTNARGSQTWGHYLTSYTIGWEPTCACGRDDTEPCVVLDPFSGVATTGVVALEQQRNYVGIELSEKYVEMSHERLRGTLRREGDDELEEIGTTKDEF